MDNDIQSGSRESITAWLMRWLAGELGVEAGGIDASRSFLSHGLNSIQAMMLAGDLENALGLPLPPTLAWDYPCVTDLADHLAGLTGPAPCAAGEGAPLAPPAARRPAGHGQPPRVEELSDDQVDELLRHYLK